MGFAFVRQGQILLRMFFCSVHLLRLCGIILALCLVFIWVLTPLLWIFFLAFFKFSFKPAGLLLVFTSTSKAAIRFYYEEKCGNKWSRTTFFFGKRTTFLLVLALVWQYPLALFRFDFASTCLVFLWLLPIIGGLKATYILCYINVIIIILIWLVFDVFF